MSKSVNKIFLAKNQTIKTLAEQYDFTIDEFVAFRDNYFAQNKNSESEVQDG